MAPLGGAWEAPGWRACEAGVWEPRLRGEGRGLSRAGSAGGGGGGGGGPSWE